MRTTWDGLPREAVDACARRELMEEAGLDLEPAPLVDDEMWPLCLAEMPPGAEVCLSAEHGTYRWVDLATAIGLIKPEWVADQLRQAAVLLGSSAG